MTTLRAHPATPIRPSTAAQAPGRGEYVRATLPPITLAELDLSAARQIRRDRKYLLPISQLGELLAHLPDGARILEIDGESVFGYSSVYLDTPGLDTYHAAGHKRRRRAKVRLRRYEATGAEFLEVKIAGPRRMTIKYRRPHNGEIPLSADAIGFVDGLLRPAHVELRTRALRPVLTTRYLRSTLHLQGDDGAYRTTVDSSLTCSTPDGGFIDLGGLAVVETKGGVRPTDMDRLLWRLGHRPCRFSKYGTTLAALTPELSPEKWFRALSHDVPAALAA